MNKPACVLEGCCQQQHQVVVDILRSWAAAKEFMTVVVSIFCSASLLACCFVMLKPLPSFSNCNGGPFLIYYLLTPSHFERKHTSQRIFHHDEICIDFLLSKKVFISIWMDQKSISKALTIKNSGGVGQHWWWLKRIECTFPWHTLAQISAWSQTLLYLTTNSIFTLKRWCCQITRLPSKRQLTTDFEPKMAVVVSKPLVFCFIYL